jgi:hypothetical protein
MMHVLPHAPTTAAPSTITLTHGAIHGGIGLALCGFAATLQHGARSRLRKDHNASSRAASSSSAIIGSGSFFSVNASYGDISSLAVASSHGLPRNATNVQILPFTSAQR